MPLFDYRGWSHKAESPGRHTLQAGPSALCHTWQQVLHLLPRHVPGTAAAPIYKLHSYVVHPMITLCGR
ncbi:hypothetical protein ABBQ38_013263 [Trebouxia sp. C0009 RCD-2024]